jgi:hypothetical protein
MAGSSVLSRSQFVASAGSVLTWTLVCAFVFGVIHRSESIPIWVKQTATTTDAAYIQCVIVIDPSHQIEVAFLGGEAKGITNVDFRSSGLDKSFSRQARLNLAGAGLSFKSHALIQFKQAEENPSWGLEMRFEVRPREAA